MKSKKSIIIPMIIGLVAAGLGLVANIFDFFNSDNILLKAGLEEDAIKKYSYMLPEISGSIVLIFSFLGAILFISICASFAKPKNRSMAAIALILANILSQGLLIYFSFRANSYYSDIYKVMLR